MKKIKLKSVSIILTAAMLIPIFAGFLSTQTVSAETVRYNYKMDMGADSEFGSLYGYSGGTSNYYDFVPPQDGYNQPLIAKAYTAGKHGNAIQITYSGYYIKNHPNNQGWPDTFNAYVMNFLEGKIKLPNEDVTLSEYMREVNSISFYVHTPVTVPHNGKPAAGYRQLDLQFVVSNGTSGETYSTRINLPNTGEWAYITVALKDFKYSFKPKDEHGVVLKDENGKDITLTYIFSDKLASGHIKTVNSFNISFPYDTYFGVSPANDQSTWTNPWVEPLKIDELLFERSTQDKPAVNPPSAGEESYHNSIGLRGVMVNGVLTEGFDAGKSVNEVLVPQYYTTQDIKDNVTAVVSAPTIPKSDTQQEVSGSTFTVTPPSAVPGDGSITVTSAGGTASKTYKLRFEKREDFQVFLQNIEGVSVGVPLTGGLKTVKVPYANESLSKSYDVSMVAVVRNDVTGEAVSVAYDEKTGILPLEESKFQVNVTVPNDGGKYSVDLYFLSSMDTMNFMFDEYNSVTGKKSVEISAGAQLVYGRALYDDEAGKAVISGRIAGHTAGDKIMLAVYGTDGTTLLNAFTAEADERGSFSYTFPFGGGGEGEHPVKIGIAGTSSETTLYLFGNIEKQNCLSEFNGLSASQNYAGFFQLYRGTLNLSEDLYNALSAENKVDALKNAKTASTVIQLRVNIEEMLVLNTLNQFNTLVSAKNVYERHNDTAKFDDKKPYFIEYIKTQAQLDAILTKVASGTYDTMEDARKRFIDSALVEAIKSVQSYGEIGTLLTDNRTQIGNRMDYSVYNSLSITKQSEFCQKLAREKNTFNDLGDLGSKLTEFNNPSVTPKPQGGGGGGGGGSVINQAVIKNEETPVPSDSEDYVLQDKKFNDLGSVPWAEEAVNLLADMGAIAGRGNGRFEPDAPVTREEFVKILLSAFSIESGSVQNSFGDVNEDEWYFKYIQTAVSTGIIKGVSEDMFGVGVNITRQDISVIIYRLLVSLGVAVEADDTVPFTDGEDIDPYAEESVYAMKSIGVVNGVAGGRFAPKQNATRAEAAKMIYGIYRYVKQ